MIEHIRYLLGFIPFHLPWFVWIHAIGLIFVGLKMTYVSNLNPSYPAGFGITTLCIGLTYLLTSWMPIQDNQFLHVSVPIRGILVTVAAHRALSMRGITSTQKKDLLGVVVWDGIGALALGYSLGTFKGIPLNYR